MIQDETILCRYCGKNLPGANGPLGVSNEVLIPQQIGRLPTQKEKRSIWFTGAICAGIITFLAAIHTLLTEQVNVIIHLGVGVVVNFVTWLLVFSFLTWLWRKLKGTLVGAIIISLIVLGVMVYLAVLVLGGLIPLD